MGKFKSLLKLAEKTEFAKIAEKWHEQRALKVIFPPSPLWKQHKIRLKIVKLFLLLHLLTTHEVNKYYGFTKALYKVWTN